MRANLFLESERRKEGKKLERKNGTYIQLFVDSPPQCCIACPLLVACLYFKLHASIFSCMPFTFSCVALLLVACNHIIWSKMTQSSIKFNTHERPSETST